MPSPYSPGSPFPYQELFRFPKLHTLNLQANEIHDWTEIPKLGQIETLRTLYLYGNPIDQLKYYRIFTVGVIPQLRKLDSTLISPRERDQADRWLVINQTNLKNVMSQRLPFAEKERKYDDDDARPTKSPGQ